MKDDGNNDHNKSGFDVNFTKTFLFYCLSFHCS